VSLAVFFITANVKIATVEIACESNCRVISHVSLFVDFLMATCSFPVTSNFQYADNSKKARSDVLHICLQVPNAAEHNVRYRTVLVNASACVLTAWLSSIFSPGGVANGNIL